MRKAVILLTLLSLLGCAETYTPRTPTSSGTVFGKCRYCGKPGYSADNWTDVASAQSKAETEPYVRDSIVCGKCRAEMEKGK